MGTNLPQFIEHARQSIDFTCYDTKWVPSSAKFCAIGLSTKGKGVLKVLSLQKSGLMTCDERYLKSGLKCSTFGASSFSNKSIAVGCFDGTVSTIDLNNLNSKEPTSWKPQEKEMHKSPINAIDAIGGVGIGYGAPEIATACREGEVKIWDPRVNQAVVSLLPEKHSYAGKNKIFTKKTGNPQEGKSPSTLPSRDCWAVCFGGSFNSQERQIAAGYDNGDLKIYDLRKNQVIWETNLQNGICSIEYDRKDIQPNKLVCTTLESKLVLFDMRVVQSRFSSSSDVESKHCFLTKRAHRSTIWGCKHLPQNRDLFVTIGGNGGVNLYKYHYPEKRKKTTLNGDIVGVIGSLELLNSRLLSTQPVVSFDWCSDKEGLCCLTAMDQTIQVHFVNNIRKF